MSTRVLVTGATGFIGRRTLARLTAAGLDVHAVARRAPAAIPGVQFHALDLHDGRATDALLAAVRPEQLLHFAWDVTPDLYVTSLDNLRWVRTTLSLVEAFVRAGGQRVVCAGTSAEYDWRYGYCSETLTPLRPASLYAASKHGLAEIIGRLSAQLGFGFAWGRVFFMYGPDEAPPRLVPSMIRAARQRTAFKLRHPAQVRDYMHVDDVGGAFVALVRSDLQGPINIASGEAVSLRELSRLVGAAAGADVALDTPPDAPDDPYPVVVADVTRLRRELGWRPAVGLTQGLQETVVWWDHHAKAMSA